MGFLILDCWLADLENSLFDSSTRLVFLTHCFTVTLPGAKNFLWFLIAYRIKLKFLSLIFKTFQNFTLSYFSSALQYERLVVAKPIFILNQHALHNLASEVLLMPGLSRSPSKVLLSALFLTCLKLVLLLKFSSIPTFPSRMTNTAPHSEKKIYWFFLSQRTQWYVKRSTGFGLKY